MNGFVTKIDLSLAEKLKNDLIDQGFEISVPPYTIFSAKKKGITCTLYQSGKLMVQGKGHEEFITFYLEPEILKDLSFTHPEIKIDFTPRIGIDEAGKGDFFGPLCVAGVYASGENIQKLIELKVRDSKLIGDTTILTMASKIRSFCPHSIIRLHPTKYNELYDKFKNLNRLLAWGHATAIDDLVRSTECKTVIIDQFASESLVENALSRKKISVSLTQRHKGEEDLVVAAASILARGAFLEGLDSLGKMAGINLPKGANSLVKETGKKIIEKGGIELLKTLCKTHFKTFEEVINA